MTGERNLPTPLWDYEINRTINDAVPELLADVLGLITHLGDGATIVALVIVFYWFGAKGDWQQRGMLMAIAVATLALSAGLKGVFDVQRPLYAAAEAGEPLAFAPETYDGLSTPSAHSMGAAAIFGGLAVVMDTGKRWQRYLVAAVIIVSVAFSRIILGVHYVGDVILGVVLGLLLVWIALWLSTEEPRSILPMFLFALLIAASSNLLGSEEFVTMSFGTALGGFLVWSVIHDWNPDPNGGAIVLLAIWLIPLLLGFRVFEALVTVDIFLEIAGTELPVMAGVRIVGYTILFGVALAIPVVAEQLNNHPHARWLQEKLPFDGRTIDQDRVEDQLQKVGD